MEAAAMKIDESVVERVRVRVLPNGYMNSSNAAKYVGRAPKTLAMWRMQGVGPEWTKNGGRVFYNKKILDTFMRGEAA